MPAWQARVHGVYGGKNVAINKYTVLRWLSLTLLLAVY